MDRELLALYTEYLKNYQDRRRQLLRLWRELEGDDDPATARLRQKLKETLKAVDESIEFASSSIGLQPIR